MFSLVAPAKTRRIKRAQQATDSAARIVLDGSGRILYANAAFCRLSAVSAEAVQNASAAEILGLEALQAGAHTLFFTEQNTGHNFHFDWIEGPHSRRYLVGCEAGAPSKPDPFWQELVEKLAQSAKESAQAMADFSYDELTCFAEMSHEILLLVNDMGEILKTSASFLSLLGYSAEELQGMHFMDLFAGEDRLFIRGLLQQNLEEQPDAPQDFEARVITQSGDHRWMQWRQQLKGDILYCTGRDITDIKAQETALRHRQKQLSEAESIARMGHWHWTIGETDMEWSDEIYRMFEVDKAAFRPTLETMNKMVHRSDIARLNQAFQRAIIEENDYEMEFRILTKAGETRHIRCEGRCDRDQEGEVYALFGVMQDMTEQVLYETELKEAKNIAERAYAARTQFLANMSHELRTPLNAIIGFSEMIERQLLGPIGTEKYLEYIGGIRESGEHLLDLISDILDMSKIEAGKYELDLEDIYPAKLIKLAAHMMEGRAHEAGVRLQGAGPLDESLKLVADRRAVLQIILNLLSNAVKFTPEGGKVEISLYAREQHCSIKVIDTGIGIPANKLANITKPFEQVSSSYARNHEGSGLGLAITKELVEMHGGSLIIESTYGEGTQVTVRLPYKQPA